MISALNYFFYGVVPTHIINLKYHPNPYYEASAYLFATALITLFLAFTSFPETIYIKKRTFLIFSFSSFILAIIFFILS